VFGLVVQHAQLVGIVGKFCTIIAGFARLHCLCCIWAMVQQHVAILWVNPAELLWLLLSFCLYCVWPIVQRDLCGYIGKFCTIIAAVARGVICVVFVFG
jgi:hypothetical protein